MAIQSMEPIKTKIIITDKIINITEEASHLNYLKTDIGYSKNYDIDVKLRKYQMICRAINNIFRTKYVVMYIFWEA